MADVYIALGGNLGDVLATFRAALRDLAAGGLRVRAVSSAYRTRALTASPDEQQPDYWNAVCAGTTTLSPRELLTHMHAVEAAHGRERRVRWAPRTLDLDLLFYDDVSVDEPELVLPHPRLAQRVFVLAPLAELAPELVVGGEGRSVRELLAARPESRGEILEVLRDWR